MNTVIKILERNIQKNINLVNFYSNYSPCEISFVRNSVILRGTSDHKWCYISLDILDDFQQLIENIGNEDQYFMIQDSVVKDYLEDNYVIEWTLKCKKLIYSKKSIVKGKEVSKIISNLECKDTKYIQKMSTYGDYTDIKYIEDRIDKGIAIGIRIDNNLVAWLLTHDDGALGFMHVLKPFRNRGYARLLTEEAIKRMIKRGDLPFVHIEETNTKSLNLAMKQGFEYYGDVYWINIKDKKFKVNHN